MYVFNMYIEIKLHSLKNLFVNIYTSMYVFAEILVCMFLIYI